MKCVLIGNPNVGKSLIFNHLTGLGVEVSNVPGTTVALESGGSCCRGTIVEIVDLPGVYSLDGNAEEEQIVRRVLEEPQTDVAIVVMNAAHLERNLYLFLQVAEYHLPTLAVLNMMDDAAARGIEIDIQTLQDQLGVEVLPTVASQGKNINRILPLAVAGANVPSLVVPYAQSIEAAVRSLQKESGANRQECLAALQGIGTNQELIDAAFLIRREIERITTMEIGQIIAANRHHLARRIVAAAVHQRETALPFDPDRILTRPVAGTIILGAALSGMLLTIILVGSFLEGIIFRLMEEMMVQPLLRMNLSPLIDAVTHSVAIALQAGIGIAFPYIFFFFLLLSILEDTGYITRAAFLSDSWMHRVGLHGGAIVPLLFGLGCNVPAIMALRGMKSRRERVIAGFLITMVPCSARTIIIMGVVAAFLGFLPAMSIYLVVAVLIALTGIFLSRTLPGDQFGMITEMAPLHWPNPVLVFQKSWNRLKEFIFIAIPLLVAGSMVLGVLDYAGFIGWFQGMTDPFSRDLLGLPSFALAALLFGILRKEMALGTLAVLAGTSHLTMVMTPIQLYTFAIISVLFIPCISTLAVLKRVLGLKLTTAIMLYSLFAGFGIGILLNSVL